MRAFIRQLRAGALITISASRASAGTDVPLPVPTKRALLVDARSLMSGSGAAGGAGTRLSRVYPEPRGTAHKRHWPDPTARLPADDADARRASTRRRVSVLCAPARSAPAIMTRTD